MNIFRKMLLPVLCLLLLLPALTLGAQAKDLDEILCFEVTVDVNDDATLNMLYHIEWMVLDSTSEGPLTWVKIGIPNSRYISMKAMSRAVKRIEYSSDGGSYARIDLDREYRKGEVVDIDFLLVQDYMYQVNGSVEGETVYSFTPSWFDDIRVDELTVRWSSSKALSVLPGAEAKKGYYSWTRSLEKGQKFTVTVSYPNDAYGFDLSKTIEEGDDEGDGFFAIIGGAVFFFGLISAVSAILSAIGRFNKTANFANDTKKVVKRTKVVYYPVCQGCGAPRPEGANNCQYCGRSFIKSEEVIEEKDLPKEEKELRGKNEDGLYGYATEPNTYMRVHVMNITMPRSSVPSRGHSSCAHSSCACACACACAGGGRAGCSVKDFYNTHLKLRQLSKKEN